MLPRFIRTTNEPTYYNSNNLFNKHLTFNTEEYGTRRNNSPRVNISQDESKYLLELATPGLSKKELRISIDQDILEVKYEFSDGEKTEETEFLSKEFSLESFTKRYSLPETVDQDNIKAKFKNGILKLEIPKITPVKEPIKEIAIA